jgi:hypothetical protein
MPNTTDQGVLNNPVAAYDTEDAADALLSRWTDADKPSDTDKEKEEDEPVVAAEESQDAEGTEAEPADESEESDDSDDDTESAEESDDADSDTSDDTDEEEESEDAEVKKVLDDDAEVEILIDKEKKKVSVKDLKRLYGQEASLTKKSQQVAAQRKEVEAKEAKYAVSLDALYKRAQTRWEPYSKVDMLVASKELTTEEFTALRKEAQEAYEEFQFVSQEANTFMQQVENQRQETLKTQAAEAVKVLQEKVPNWSNELYDKIRKFAVDNGMDSTVINRLVDPAALMLINKARLYEEGKKVVLKKKPKVPAKVLKPGTTTSKDITTDKSKAAMAKLRQSGNSEDAMEALMARWADN